MDLQRAYNALGVGGQIANAIWDSATGIDPNKDIAMQIALNTNMSKWNLENITKPVFQMEADEWDRRFNAQNTYNDPKAQIARMQAAGLNPALLQGETGAMEAGNPSINEAASAFAQQPDLARLQTANAEADLARAKTIQTSIDNITAPMLNWGKVKLQNVEFDLGKSNIDWTKARTEQDREKIQLVKNQADLILQSLQESKTRIEEIHQKIKNLIAQEGLTKAQEGLINTQERGQAIQNDLNLFERDIQRNQMYSTYDNGTGVYYDPVNSWLARYWKNTRKWAIQSYIDTHNILPYQQMVLKAQANHSNSLADFINFVQIPLGKNNVFISDMTKWPRMWNVLGNITIANNKLKLQSQTLGFDHWFGWLNGSLKMGLNSANTIADFADFYVNRNLDKASKLSGILTGHPIGGNSNEPGSEGHQSTGMDIWDTTNSGGYNIEW